MADLQAVTVLPHTTTQCTYKPVITSCYSCVKESTFRTLITFQSMPLSVVISQQALGVRKRALGVWWRWQQGRWHSLRARRSAKDLQSGGRDMSYSDSSTDMGDSDTYRQWEKEQALCGGSVWRQCVGAGSAWEYGTRWENMYRWYCL